MKQVQKETERNVSINLRYFYKGRFPYVLLKIEKQSNTYYLYSKLLYFEFCK